MNLSEHEIDLVLSAIGTLELEYGLSEAMKALKQRLQEALG